MINHTHSTIKGTLLSFIHCLHKYVMNHHFNTLKTYFVTVMIKLRKKYLHSPLLSAAGAAAVFVVGLILVCMQVKTQIKPSIHRQRLKFMKNSHKLRSSELKPKLSFFEYLSFSLSVWLSLCPFKGEVNRKD